MYPETIYVHVQIITRKNILHLMLIFVGYLGKADVIDAVIYFISQFPDTKVILDPIMGDHGVYYTNFDESYGAAMRKILPYADVILPNLTEMYLLAGKEYQLTGNHRNVLHLCEILRELGAKNMIITSVPKDDCKKGYRVIRR